MLCLPGFIAFAVEEFIMHGFAQLLAFKHVAHGEFIAVVVNGNNQCFFMIGKHRFCCVSIPLIIQRAMTKTLEKCMTCIVVVLIY